jgi:hypothetical protein
MIGGENYRSRMRKFVNADVQNDDTIDQQKYADEEPYWQHFVVYVMYGQILYRLVHALSSLPKDVLQHSKNHADANTPKQWTLIEWLIAVVGNVRVCPYQIL